MTFRRTGSGLSNFYLFVDADVVVFVEGGLSITRLDVDNGKFTECSSDIRFWQQLFNIYKPDLKYQFRSIGSKETLKSIAKDIDGGEITRVIVAMDRDFDHINERIISSKNVIYTNGYSWENEAWNEKTILEAFCSLSGASMYNLGNEFETIRKMMDSFSKRVRAAVRIDAILSQYGSSLFDRKKPQRYVVIEKNSHPKVNVDQVKKSLSEARSRNGKPIIRKSDFCIDGLSDCFGHLLAEYTYRLLVYLLETVKKMPKVPKEYAAGMVVEKFGQALKSGVLPELKQYYDREFSRLTH